MRAKAKDNTFTIRCDCYGKKAQCSQVIKTGCANWDAAKRHAKNKGWYVDRHGQWTCPQHDA
jgi:hypothetical protein